MKMIIIIIGILFKIAITSISVWLMRRIRNIS